MRPIRPGEIDDDSATVIALALASTRSIDEAAARVGLARDLFRAALVDPAVIAACARTSPDHLGAAFHATREVAITCMHDLMSDPTVPPQIRYDAAKWSLLQPREFLQAASPKDGLAASYVAARNNVISILERRRRSEQHADTAG